MTRPKMLDLFCGAGGASMGYHRAGFDVVGVDIAPQPNYPFKFIEDDAMWVLRRAGAFGLGGFAAVHASPPCQGYSGMSNCRPGLAEEYARLVADVRRRLDDLGVPWVIENVVGSDVPQQQTIDGRNGLVLCGQMFGLDLYRHRLFESSFPVAAPVHPRHTTPASRAGHWEPGTVISVAGHCSPIAEARRAMGIDWMPRAELAESIPPAYTEFIGAQLLAALRAAA